MIFTLISLVALGVVLRGLYFFSAGGAVSPGAAVALHKSSSQQSPPCKVPCPKEPAQCPEELAWCPPNALRSPPGALPLALEGKGLQVVLVRHCHGAGALPNRHQGRRVQL